MRLKDAMTAFVVAAFILTATRRAAAQSTEGAPIANPGHELIGLTPADGIMPYLVANNFEASFAGNASVDSGVLLPDQPGWSQAYSQLDFAAVESTGFETAALMGMHNYPAGALGAPVPEPASLALLLTGLAALTVAAGRRRKARRTAGGPATARPGSYRA
jgi:hypothetical protein